jgi:adenylate cyclase
LEEVKRAIAEDRLFMLPIERALAGPAQYTAREVSDRSGVALEFVLRIRHALGVAKPDPDERSFSDHDLEAAKLFGRLLEAGIDAEGLLDVARLFARGLSAGADAVRGLVGRPLLEAGLGERELAMRNAQILDQTLPLTGPLLAYVMRVELLEHIRNEVVGLAEMRSEGRVPGSRDVAVCFADIVGFTPLGERLSIAEIGELASRLEDLAAEVVEPPVRLVKTIGDAVMLVSEEVDPAAETALRLLEELRADEDSPSLRAGIAYGTAVNRSGDWYGATVNRASRLAAAADADCVVCDAAARNALGSRFAATELGARSLKGIAEPTEMFAIARSSRPRP